MTQTRVEILNLHTDNQTSAAFGGLGPDAPDVVTAQSDGFGSLLLALAPVGFTVRTGLVSNATHVDGPFDAAGNLVPEAGRIYSVRPTGGATELTIIRAGAAGAGEVLIVYDTAGVPTLTFGDGANVGYQVDKSRLSADFVAKMTQVFA